MPGRGTATPAAGYDAATATDLVAPARTFADLLTATGTPEDDAHDLYRRLARALHPDTSRGTGEEFAHLADLWTAHQSVTPAAGGRNAGASGGGATTRITTRRADYLLGDLAATGDLANLYHASMVDLTATDPHPEPVLLKLARDPRNNDLLDNEARILAHLRSNADPDHAAYLPTLRGTLRHRDTGTGIDRRVLALAPAAGFHTLTQVAATRPGGLDARDVAWMWRRLLVALGVIHRAGVVHGAVNPDHVLIHPAQHGLMLVDFAYATTGTPIAAAVGRHRDFYAPEVFDKAPATAGTDIYAASKVAEHLMGTRAPRQLRAFVNGCTLANPNTRPDDAWRLLAELDELLERLYGPRRFRPFQMPPTATPVVAEP